MHKESINESTWLGSAVAIAWTTFRASRQICSSPVRMRCVTMRLSEQSRGWLVDRAEETDSSHSAAAPGLSATLRRVERATRSSLYQELRRRIEGGQDWQGWERGHWVSTPNRVFRLWYNRYSNAQTVNRKWEQPVLHLWLVRPFADLVQQSVGQTQVELMRPFFCQRLCETGAGQELQQGKNQDGTEPRREFGLFGH